MRNTLQKIYANALIVNEEEDTTGKLYVLPYMLADIAFHFLPITNQSAFIPRFLLSKIGGWDEDLHYAMDWDLFAKLGLIQAEFHFHNRFWRLIDCTKMVRCLSSLKVRCTRNSARN